MSHRTRRALTRRNVLAGAAAGTALLALPSTLRAQAPHLPARNFILEPCRRDVAAAVALAFFTMEKDGVGGPFMFQWSDNLKVFTRALLRIMLRPLNTNLGT